MVVNGMAGWRATRADDEAQRALIVEFRSPSLKTLCLHVAIHHCINKEIVSYFFKKRSVILQPAVRTFSLHSLAPFCTALTPAAELTLC